MFWFSLQILPETFLILIRSRTERDIIIFIIMIMIIMIVIIIIIITISFMQGIYTYFPETNNVPKEYNVAAILSLLFMVPISLVPVLTL
jgi:hypothetical protein